MWNHPRLTSALRRVLPHAAVHWYRSLRYGRSWFDPQDRSVEGTFTEIYRRGVWGRSDRRQPFNSGPGSAPAVAMPYVQAVHALVEARAIRSVVDLGCGDFRVGSLLVRPTFQYCGVDVVEALVRHNRARFSSPTVRFERADLITDDLPPAELCLVRQVLQHLSNDQVRIILDKCKRYPLVVVTEHLPDASLRFQPNRDIEHGNETRVDIGSGLVLDAPPFNQEIEGTLCDVPLEDGTLLRSVLIVNQPSERGYRDFRSSMGRRGHPDRSAGHGVLGER